MGIVAANCLFYKYIIHAEGSIANRLKNNLGLTFARRFGINNLVLTVRNSPQTKSCGEGFCLGMSIFRNSVRALSCHWVRPHPPRHLETLGAQFFLMNYSKPISFLPHAI